MCTTRDSPSVVRATSNFSRKIPFFLGGSCEHMPRKSSPLFKCLHALLYADLFWRKGEYSEILWVCTFIGWDGQRKRFHGIALVFVKFLSIIERGKKSLPHVVEIEWRLPVQKKNNYSTFCSLNPEYVRFFLIVAVDLARLKFSGNKYADTRSKHEKTFERLRNEEQGKG